MRTKFVIIGLLITNLSLIYTQKLDVEGSIQLTDSEDPTLDPGTIRWTGSDFEVKDGMGLP